MNTSSSIVVAALYRFVPLPDYRDLRLPLRQQMEQHGVRGSLLLAGEGINGTIAGSRHGIDALLSYLRRDPRFQAVDVKESRCDEMPFKRTRVRLKKEIVTMGVEGIDPNDSVGTYVDPEQWNDLISDPEVTLIDTRNDYETAIGSFRGALDPATQSFREFPAYVQQNLDPAIHKKVAMFCTGGIRCEKSTAFLKQQGFEEVYHLRGGILKYLETVPPEQSQWYGQCFVFDQRVAVGHNLEVGDQVMCFGCGWPVTKAQQQHSDYMPGVQCPRCADRITDEQRQRFSERQRQHQQMQSESAQQGLPQLDGEGSGRCS